MKLTSDMHEDIITDVDKFNEFLYDLTNDILERVLLEIPALVSYHVQEVSKIRALRDKFYKDYPELKGKEGLIIQSVNKISSDNPAMPREEVYKKAGDLAKRILETENNNG